MKRIIGLCFVLALAACGGEIGPEDADRTSGKDQLVGTPISDCPVTSTGNVQCPPVTNDPSPGSKPPSGGGGVEESPFTCTIFKTKKDCDANKLRGCYSVLKNGVFARCADPIGL